MNCFGNKKDPTQEMQDIATFVTAKFKIIWKAFSGMVKCIYGRASILQ